MSQRSSLIVFCSASALAGGIVATQSSGKDRASAQVSIASQASPATTLVSFPRQYPTWKYWYGVVPDSGRMQVLAPGTTGVIHALYFPPGSSTVELHEGAEGVIMPIIRLGGGPGAQTITVLDARFTDGLKVINLGGYGGTPVTVLYSIDEPISTAPLDQ